MIDHLCVSLHCNVQEVLDIISDGLFEGILISMNPQNYDKWQPVLKAAKEKNIGIATMNTLGGGLVPRYPQLFKMLDETDDSAVIKALNFMRSFEELDVCISGMSNKAQIDENCVAFNDDPRGTYIKTAAKRDFAMPVTQKLCSGCNY